MEVTFLAYRFHFMFYGFKAQEDQQERKKHIKTIEPCYEEKRKSISKAYTIVG